MQIIPVIDLASGLVVHARQGERASYRPIQSARAGSAAPGEVVAALLAHPWCRPAASGEDTPPGADAAAAPVQLYVADLDALAGGAPQAEAWAAMAEPALAAAAGARPRWWIDAGVGDAQALERFDEAWQRARQRAPALAGVDAVPVFATEAQHDHGAWSRLRQLRPASPLSLDRRAGRWLDPLGLMVRPQQWPHDVIVMTLESVGSGQGPDLGTVAALRARQPAHRWIGSGGLRGEADRQRAAASGAAAWLAASVLHLAAVPD